MARNKTGKCGCKNRIISNVANNISSGCFDVCTTPLCGSPDYLDLMAPVIYDEIGINLCTTFALGVDIPTTYPTASEVSVQIVDISYSYGTGNVVITPISGRQNCYSVTLTNLTVEFVARIYDNTCRLLDTVTVSAVYLPSDTTASTYDEDTNPSSVELEIFAPYGVSYNTDGTTPTAALNNIGFASSDNFVKQGLNLYGIPKVLNFDETESTITVGVTLVLQSLYFVGYKVANAGKIQIPKGSIISPEDSDCMRFVAGDLLNLEIKPLELGPPNCEEQLKTDCTPSCTANCTTTGCNSGSCPTGTCGTGNCTTGNCSTGNTPNN